MVLFEKYKSVITGLKKIFLFFSGSLAIMFLYYLKRLEMLLNKHFKGCTI